MTKTISNTQKNLNKEESIMTKRGLALIDKETNQVVETTLDELDYETIVNLKELTKDVLRIMLEEENVLMSNNKFNRTKRIDLINMLYNLMHPSVETDTEAEASNVTDGNELTDNNKEESTMNQNSTVPVGDLEITNDNAPENVEELNNNKEEDTTMPENKPVVTKDIAMDLLKRIILQADKNDAHNFISHWMVTSFIAEAITGKPLKGKDENNKWVEFSFTDEEKKAIADAREEFVKLAKFTTIRNKKNEIAGYVIPAKSLVYGRHVWLGRTCVYHFKANNKTTVYHVSLNGIKNVETNNITPLDDKAYATLESKCKFIC